MAKILLVEDNLNLAQLLIDWLKFNKYTVEHATNGEDACHLLDLSSYDIVVLDWELPGKSGLEVCSAIRTKGGTIPVLMLTGKDAPLDKVAALDTGADDYVTKPFNTDELGARIRALLRRGKVESSSKLVAGALELDRVSHEVSLNGKKLRLFPKEYSMLELFMNNQNRVFSLADILNSIWTMDSNGSEETVRTFMKTLRRKVTAEGCECPIKTVYGFGYKFEV